MSVQIQLRRGTSAEWASTNPILAQGEMGVTTDTKIFKIGDGINAWNSLPLASGVTSHDQLTGLSDDDHTQYALADGSRGNFAATSHTHDASAIVSGTIDIARLPASALERIVVVTDDTARFALTTATVQNGDVVKVTATDLMYYVKDQTQLNVEAGYEVFKAGSAASVPWTGITGKPSTYPPSTHTHTLADITDEGTLASQNSNNVTITGGTINGTSVGATTASSGRFTTLESTGNATLGDAEATDTHSIKGATTLLANSSSDALKITQTGSGNALVIEDASPDSTPFVVDTNGRLTVGSTTGIIPISGLASGVGVHSTGTQGNVLSSFQWSTDTIQPFITMSKSRGATPGTHTAVANSDAVGTILWTASDGSQFNQVARVEALVGGTVSSGVVPGLWRISVADSTGALVEALRVDSKQRLLLNTVANNAGAFEMGSKITGATTAYGITNYGTVQTDVTASAQYFTSTHQTAANTNVSEVAGFRASQGSFGAGSTVTNQYGFVVSSTLTGGTNNFGFYSNIAAGTGRWNFYSNGTASNYFAGNVGFGSSNPVAKTHVVTTGASDGSVDSRTALHIQATNITTGFANTRIQFSYSANTPKAYIEAGVYGRDYVAISSDGVSETFRLDSSGNLRIGDYVTGGLTTTTGVDLMVSAVDNPLVSVVDNGNGSTLIGSNSTHGYIGVDGTRPISFKTGCTYNVPDSGTTRMTVANNGDVLIGTSTNTHSAKLVVSGEIAETVGGVQYKVVSQTDVGTASNQIPLNQNLGDMAFQSRAGLTLLPQASATPSAAGEMAFELTSNTSLTIKVRGTDGVLRSAVITLA